MKMMISAAMVKKMTNEEAAALLKKWQRFLENQRDGVDSEAFEMAIKALEADKHECKEPEE